jgi:hypothetical protein
MVMQDPASDSKRTGIPQTLERNANLAVDEFHSMLRSTQVQTLSLDTSRMHAVFSG